MCAHCVKTFSRTTRPRAQNFFITARNRPRGRLGSKLYVSGYTNRLVPRRAEDPYGSLRWAYKRLTALHETATALGQVRTLGASLSASTCLLEGAGAVLKAVERLCARIPRTRGDFLRSYQ